LGLVQESYVRALALLSAHRPELSALADALLSTETLNEADAYRIAGIPHELDQPPPAVASSETP